MLPSTSGLAVMIIVIVAVWTTPINGFTTRKLDESSVSGTPDSGIKCTPCSEQHPPPSPPPPSLPPPPPPTPTNPTTQYCPPPPSSSGKSPPAPFYYITGPPGNLYPFDPYYSGSSRNSVAGIGLLVLVGCGLLLGLLAF